MTGQVEGQLYRNGSSACQAVNVLFSAGQFYLSVDGKSIALPQPQQYRVSDKLGSTPREITFDNGDVLSLPSTTLVDGWLKGSDGDNALGWLEKSKRMIAISVVLVPLAVFAIYKYVIPQAAIHFADMVPYAVTNTASKQTLAAMDETILDPSEIDPEKQQQYISQWSATMEKLPLNNQHFNIQFRKSETFGANAFALPNGTIVFTDAMVKLVEQNEQLLLAILLHEIGHVEQKHSMRLVAQSVASAVVVNYLFGDFSAMADLLTGSATAVVQNNFSQQLEWEADNYALEQLDTLGMSRDTFAQAMEKLAQLHDGDESELNKLFSSHPLMRERIQNARNENDN